MNNKFKKAYIAMITAAMAMGTAGAKDKTSKTTDAAERITIGSVIKCADKEIADKDLSVTEYYIDQDGDGRADVVRSNINRIGNKHIKTVGTPTPLTIVKVIEMYDPKHNMWNIVEINKIGSREINLTPKYVPQQKTR